jgi:uncharacterized membrane protein
MGMKKYPFPISVKSEIVPVILLLLAFASGIYFYQHFPPNVVGHWNFAGEPNGYLPRFWGAFTIPLLIAGMYILFMALPIIDPLSERYVTFFKAYTFIRNAVLTTLFIIFIMTGIYNLGYHVRIGVIIPIIIGILMLAMGNYLREIKPNWFVGIRTPWTLSSERVWNKTHRIGGWMFALFGLLLIAIPFLPPRLGVSAFVFGIIIIIAVPVIYSYIIYQEEKKLEK